MRRLASVLAAAGAASALAAGIAGANTSHDGWPKINGELWINHHDVPSAHYGTHRNDELLSGHSSDRVFGGRGRDVLWGDFNPRHNNAWQHDLLDSGPGNDFIYASHGYNAIDGGTGHDVVHAHFGRGTIDCGPDRDILFISHHSRPHYKIRHCERISYRPAKAG
jgi:Ca2+-binding RTX toxin-like protein